MAGNPFDVPATPGPAQTPPPQPQATQNPFDAAAKARAKAAATPNPFDVKPKPAGSADSGVGGTAVPLPANWHDSITTAAKQYGVDPRLIYADFGAESSFGQSSPHAGPFWQMGLIHGPGKYGGYGYKGSGQDTYDEAFRTNAAIWAHTIKEMKAKGLPTDLKSVVAYQEKTYAPVGADNDPNNLNANKVSNMDRLLTDADAIFNKPIVQPASAATPKPSPKPSGNPFDQKPHSDAAPNPQPGHNPHDATGRRLPNQQSPLDTAFDALDIPFIAADAMAREGSGSHGDLANVLGLLQKGPKGLHEAAQRYNLMSPEQLKFEADRGDKVAGYFLEHPTQAGLAQGLAEFANPASYAAGGLIGKPAGMAWNLLKLSPGGRAVASFFSPFRNIAVAGGEAGKRAMQALAVRVAGAPARAQSETLRIFGNLSASEKEDVVHIFQGNLHAVKTTDPKRMGVLFARSRFLDDFVKDISEKKVQAGLLDPTTAANRPNHFPLGGAFEHPAGKTAEDYVNTWLEGGQRGGKKFSTGTEHTEAKFKSLHEAQTGGGESFQVHRYQRTPGPAQASPERGGVFYAIGHPGASDPYAQEQWFANLGINPVGGQHLVTENIRSANPLHLPVGPGNVGFKSLRHLLGDKVGNEVAQFASQAAHGSGPNVPPPEVLKFLRDNDWIPKTGAPWGTHGTTPFEDLLKKANGDVDLVLDRLGLDAAKKAGHDAVVSRKGVADRVDEFVHIDPSMQPVSPKVPLRADFNPAVQLEKWATSSLQRLDLDDALKSAPQSLVRPEPKGFSYEHAPRDQAGEPMGTWEDAVKKHPELANIDSPVLKKSIVSPSFADWLAKNRTRIYSPGPQYLPNTTATNKVLNAGLHAFDHLNEWQRRAILVNPLIHPVFNLAQNTLGAGVPFSDVAGLVTKSVINTFGGGKLLDKFLPQSKGFTSAIEAALKDGALAELKRGDTRMLAARFRDLNPAQWPSKLLNEAGAWNSRATFGKYGEQAFATTMYRHLIRQGIDGKEAGGLVREALGNYQNVVHSGLEGGLNRLVFFYPWLKGNLPYWTRTLATRPQNVAAPHQAARANNLLVNDPSESDPKHPQYAKDFSWVVGDRKNGFQTLTPILPQRMLNDAQSLVTGDPTTIVKSAINVAANRAVPLAHAGFDLAKTALLPAASPLDPRNFSTVFDKDAPREVQHRQMLENIASELAPIPLLQDSVKDALRRGLSLPQVERDLRDRGIGAFSYDRLSKPQEQGLHKARSTFVSQVRKLAPGMDDGEKQRRLTRLYDRYQKRVLHILGRDEAPKPQATPTPTP